MKGEGAWVWEVPAGTPVHCPMCDVRCRDLSHDGFKCYTCGSCGRRYTLFDLVIPVPRTVPVGPSFAEAAR